MAILYVKKNGTGNSTTIQGAIYNAVNGDTIDVEAGTFYENVEIASKNITLKGAGRDLTIIQGKLANDTMTCSWFAGDSVINAVDTSVAIVGKTVSGTNLTTTKISEVISNTQIRLAVATPTTGNYTKTVSAYQTVAFSVAPTSGTFKLRYNGVDTASINWNATTATIQTALRAVAGLSTVVVTGTIASKLLNIACDGVALPVLPITVSTNALLPALTITPTLIDGLVLGSSTIILPSTTSVVVGHKVEGTGVNATITAWNSTTKTITISSPITQTGSGVLLTFRLPRTNVTVTQSSNYGSTGFGSILVNGITDGVVIKDLTALGFEGTVGQEAAALFFTAGTSPGHTNYLVENCRFTAVGDCAVLCGSNPYMNNGIFQYNIIDGKTFTGSEPADVPSFSTYVANGVIQSIGASSSVIRFSDMRGIIVGRGFTCASAFAGSATISAVSGNDVTFNKIATFNVGDTLACTFTLTAYQVPNCARNLFYIGQNITPNNTQNIIFRNNTVNGQTGAVISATGSVSMFNSAVSIECINALVEDNVIDGIFGAGPNPLQSNYAIRCRQTGAVVQNNLNYTLNNRENSGYLVSLGTSLNNLTIDQGYVTTSQPSSGVSIDTYMGKSILEVDPIVSNDPIFSNQSNWHLVSFIFLDESNSKRIYVAFKDFDGLRKMKLRNGLSGEKYLIHKIILSDVSRQLLVLDRADIQNSASYDFTLL